MKVVHVDHQAGIAAIDAIQHVAGFRQIIDTRNWHIFQVCLLYTSDAADERSSVDLGGRRIIKKKKQEERGRGRREKDDN